MQSFCRCLASRVVCSQHKLHDHVLHQEYWQKYLANYGDSPNLPKFFPTKVYYCTVVASLFVVKSVKKDKKLSPKDPGPLDLTKNWFVRIFR